MCPITAIGRLFFILHKPLELLYLKDMAFYKRIFLLLKLFFSIDILPLVKITSTAREYSRICSLLYLALLRPTIFMPVIFTIANRLKGITSFSTADMPLSWLVYQFYKTGVPLIYHRLRHYFQHEHALQVWLD